jgi:ribosome-associated protein
MLALDARARYISPITLHIDLPMTTTSKTTDAAAKKDVTKLQLAIVNGLEDVKAQDIQVFDTEHLSPLFERVIVASGTSNRQTKALAASVRDAVRDAGFAKPRIEGEDNGEWIIVDCGAAVAHIMQPTIRQYYRLEELWGEKPVRLKIGAAKPTSGAAAALADKKSAQKAAKSDAKTGAKTGVKTSAKVASKTAAKKTASSVSGKSTPAAKKTAPKAAGGTKTVVAKNASSTAVAKAKTPIKTVVVKPTVKKTASKTAKTTAAPRKVAAKKTAAPKNK